jgi:signal transduction histidine kinase
MNERTAGRLAVTLWGLILAFNAAGAVMQFLTRNDAVSLSSDFGFRGADLVLGLSMGSIGALIAARRPKNALGWLLLGVGAMGSLSYLLSQYVVVSVFRHGASLPFTIPLGWVQYWLWEPMTGVLVFYVIGLFPDGRPLSPAWGRFLKYLVPPVLLLFGAGVALVSEELAAFTDIQNPYTVPKSVLDPITAVGSLMFIGCLVATIVSVVKRYRRSSGVAREQMKWLALSGSSMALALAVAIPVFITAEQPGTTSTSALSRVMEFVIIVSVLGIPGSMAIAILRSGLWSIDVVINKAVVFAALAAGIAAAYVAIVFGVGAAVGLAGEPNVPLSVAATALVALAFQPLRAWARRVANRLVYGKRATPHDVLTVLGKNISEAFSLDDVLPRLAQLVTEATAASHAEVWLRVGDEMRSAAGWPADAPTGATLPAPDGDRDPAIPGTDGTFPVRHQGELLGAVAVRTPPNETLTIEDERLLSDLASHAGLVLRNVRLIEELRASRQRLVSAQDLERRKIERNLHDGAQQHLVALSINLGLAQTMLDADPGQAREILTQLKSDASEALENLRDLARGIYPPLLADRGLSAALTSHAAKAPVPTKVEAGEVARYPMEVEAAIYFCVLEALQNVAKYAGASSAVVRLAEDNGHITFAVTDDGAGFDVARAARGAGLTNMTDRIEALGGRLEVSSRPGAGTTIRGWVSSAPAPAS